MPARARATRKQADPEPEVEETKASSNGEKDFTNYADKEITPTMEAFADFLVDEVYDGELPEDFDEDSFRKGVALGGSVRMDFQRSEYWAADERNRKNRVEEEEPEEEEPTPRRSGRAARRQAQTEETPPPARSKRRGKAAPEPEPEEIDDEDIEDELEDEEEEEVVPEPAKPVRSSRRGTAAAKKAAETDTDKPATRRSRRGVKDAEASGAAPY